MINPVRVSEGNEGLKPAELYRAVRSVAAACRVTSSDTAHPPIAFHSRTLQLQSMDSSRQSGATSEIRAGEHLHTEQGRGGLPELIREASAVLRDASATAEERIRRAEAILRQSPWAQISVQEGPKTQGVDPPKRGGLARWQIRRVKVFIDESLGHTVTVADMAASVRLSPHHFCRAFRVSLNETPHNYLIRVRIERAQALMRTSGTPLSQIADECGFADQAHFNKLFRKMVGESPGVWRRVQVETCTSVDLAVHGAWRGAAHATEVEPPRGFSNRVQSGPRLGGHYRPIVARMGDGV